MRMLRGVLGCLRISWLSADETRPFERQHHLVNRGRADAEVFLHVGFSRRPTVQAGVVLLAADAGAGDEEIARSVGVGGSTVYRTKRRFVLGDLHYYTAPPAPSSIDEELAGDAGEREVNTAVLWRSGNAVPIYGMRFSFIVPLPHAPLDRGCTGRTL